MSKAGDSLRKILFEKMADGRIQLMFIPAYGKPCRLVGLLISAFFLVACQGDPTSTVSMITVTSSPAPDRDASVILLAESTQTPTATEVIPSETPIPSPIQTETPVPSATQTAVPRGALSWAQEARLYQASLKFLADNEDDATVIVRDQIDYLESLAEHPSLVCGPLSAVILRDAGLLPPDVDLHGFWLLNPRLRPSQIILETYFPPERYEWYRFDQSTAKFDFNAFPLLPGDFLYLYAGINGTFEHIITVTRVDEEGRAFTVTNLDTEEGFVIRELMLYDPNDPGVGQFYDWMNREINGMLGMTGDGGFDLWRPIGPVQDFAVR